MTVLHGIDARSGERLDDPVPASSGEQVREACAAAEDAAAALARLPAAARARLLEQVAEALDEAGPGLVALADTETALGSGPLTAELTRATNQLRLLATEVQREDFAAPRWEEGAFARMLSPVGPVAVYAASNFPFALSVAGSDTAAALAAGCPVVVKAHPGHPLTSRRTGEVAGAALRDAGAPDGTFAVLHGMEAGTALIRDPRIRAAAFTGSRAGGRALFDAAAARPDPIPFYGELGSVNPVFVTEAAVRARGEELVQGYLTSLTRYHGQLCTNPGVLLLPSGHGLTEPLRKAVGGAEPAPMLNARILENYRAGLERLSRSAAGLAAVPDGPHLFTTTAAEFRARPELAEECFGPAGLVVEYASRDEALELARDLPGSLTATLHAEEGDPEDETFARELLPVLTRRAGRVVWNGWPTGVAVNRTMHHGGPWPATTGAQFTSIGTESVRRFQVPVVYQGVPERLLPGPLRR
ncbi:aldehyde dehydrogenase family protein [Streptomyces sp. JJ36]|uniref:aldehyde dehydrogenase family protein n=1 Tax=Streptomyces sp. JJ36 TaxID=2736645 RepID=UPI001F2F5210|nr:aldehyde dehydrogenase family protein [Streptomyces sp. JJ36]MCF6524566.1 aldehyde dehydrogenase family protein [Streptomyces sp. JJ36]